MSTLSWLLNFVPTWLWLAAAGLALALTAQFWLPIWAVLPRWLKAVLLGAVALLTAYLAGRNRGARDERDQRAARDARAIKTRKEIDDAIRDRPAADVDRDLDRWMRDGE